MWLSQGLAPQYGDVIHEDGLRVGLHVKAPDYAFTLHGQRKFFLEAKKPAVNIKCGNSLIGSDFYASTA